MKSSACKASILLIFLLLGTFSTASAQYYYTISQNNLSIRVTLPGAGYVTPGPGYYYYGSTIIAQAYTNPGYVFDGWYLNGVYQGKLSSIPITMTQDYVLTAAFSVRTVCLTITNNPGQGGTTAPMAGIWNYTYGSIVTISEQPAPGCTFSGWYLDGEYQGLGTSITVPMTQDRQLGAFFAGNISISEPSGSPETPAPPPVSGLPAPSLAFYCTSSTTVSGFRVQLQGVLAYDQIGLTGAGISFSYSANGGSTWHDLAYLLTDDDGAFSAVWMPSASGNYIVKGIWTGDEVYSGVGTTVNFAVTPMEIVDKTNEDSNIFSVSSNSTLSELAFNSAKEEISFTVSGESGTAGFVQTCIPKSLISDVENLKVYLDGQEISYSIISEGDVWIVTIGYHHSTHKVSMELNGDTSQGFLSSLTTVDLIVIVAVVVLLVVAIVGIIVFKQRKHSNRK
ncbi:InlB B-repeat-containing protein [Candidatus Bathycorpusculum sp.]|uniref:InlB B-repeat-containing protein n=1 Tax=Candidatus Bathycorpusculum sp. TaxID=2994959 RepID=UPI00282226BA|nr:InlB B-repeat-containing protein [Candidatus Termitimicrobium sp.]MCL2431244.1 InlB B-repeat-containing protein [Candidatus Termitimicrobium sp.]